MKSVLAFAAIALLALPLASFGGEITLEPVEPVNASYLFEAGEIQLEGLGYYLPDAESSGGGVGIGYFFTNNIGVRAQGLWGRAEASDLRTIYGDLILRYPFEDFGLAPYIYGGGGAGELDLGSYQGLIRAGGGVEWRLTPGLGVFGEGNHVWTENSTSFSQILFGVRVLF